MATAPQPAPGMQQAGMQHPAFSPQSGYPSTSSFLPASMSMSMTDPRAGFAPAPDQPPPQAAEGDGNADLDAEALAAELASNTEASAALLMQALASMPQVGKVGGDVGKLRFVFVICFHYNCVVLLFKCKHVGLCQSFAINCMLYYYVYVCVIIMMAEYRQRSCALPAATRCCSVTSLWVLHYYAHAWSSCLPQEDVQKLGFDGLLGQDAAEEEYDPMNDPY